MMRKPQISLLGIIIYKTKLSAVLYLGCYLGHPESLKDSLESPKHKVRRLSGLET